MFKRKYRIIQIGDRFYPQKRVWCVLWFMWDNFVSPGSEVAPEVFFNEEQARIRLEELMKKEKTGTRIVAEFSQ